MSVALFLLFLLPIICDAQSVPVYGRFQTCVTLEESSYRNPFNYSEV